LDWLGEIAKWGAITYILANFGPLLLFLLAGVGAGALAWKHKDTGSGFTLGSLRGLVLALLFVGLFFVGVAMLWFPPGGGAGPASEPATSGAEMDEVEPDSD